MRSISTRMKWWIDLPKLTSLSAGDGNTFCFPHHVTLKSLAFLFHSLVDIPELKEVILPKGFSHARTVVTRGSIFVSHMSLLDVGAFQSFLSEKGIPTSHTVFDWCSTYSLLCYHTHSCTSHHSHFFHFLSILVISTHTICHTFSQSSLHSSLFFPVLPIPFFPHSPSHPLLLPNPSLPTPDSTNTPHFSPLTKTPFSSRISSWQHFLELIWVQHGICCRFEEGEHDFHQESASGYYHECIPHGWAE